MARTVRGRHQQKATVKIDRNHADYVRALVTVTKPAAVLEFGFGAGESTRAILAGLAYNQARFSYTLVDNWMDWHGQRPRITRRRRYRPINFVTSDEKAFVESCTETFDFILSDADHFAAERWFDLVYDELLRPGGVLIYHDVTNPYFGNLREILERVAERTYRHALFDHNSLPGERCDRGLLVLFKDR